MRKIYFVLFLCCINFAAFSQSTTVTVNATGTPGSYKTGYIDNVATPTRNDGNLKVHAGVAPPVGDQRGWAVFNLPAVIQPSATVTAVKLRFTINATANITDNAAIVGIYGYVGDLSTVTVPSTVYTDCNGSGVYASFNFCGTQWGSTPGTDLLTLNSNGIGFINTNSGSLVSLGWQCNSNTAQTYTITGEAGTAATQPQLQITYNCTGVSGVAATATPNPLCAGSTLTLTGLGAGTTTYSWSGPGGFTSTMQNPTLTVAASSAGVYTFTAYNPGGCATTATTATVTVNPLPAPITAVPTYLCINSVVTLSDASPSGTWSATSTTVGTVNAATGAVKGVSAGNVVITYHLPTTCITTTTITIVPRPTAIIGANSVCVSQTTTLSATTIGGTWSSSNTTIATVNTTALVSGVSMATANITYAVGFDCYSVHTMTVNPLAPITGVDSICNGSTTYLADIIGIGTWSSASPGIASIDTFSGLVTGVSAGVSGITFTTPAGCITTHPMTIIAIPPPITGIMKACPGTSSVLANTSPGGVWSSDNNGVATTGPSGIVYGVFADTVTINYTVRPGCSVHALFTVNPNPSPIIGINGICATLVDSLYDTTSGGVWSTTTPSLVTISATGVITALSGAWPWPGGNAIIVYTLPITGCMITKTIIIHPLPHPVINFNNITNTLWVDSFYASYQWYSSTEGLIPGATSPSIAGLFTQDYWVTVTDTFGCVKTSIAFPYNIAMAVKNIVTTPIRVYPNPANATLNIESPARVRAVITSIDGKIQLEQANAKEIDVSRLSDGMYFIMLYNDDQQVITTRKFIKQ